MKPVMGVVICAILMCLAPSAKAWNCSDPLAERVLVPAGTAGTYGDADGQLANFNGQLYECEVVKPSVPGTPTATNTNSNQNSNSNNNSANATGGKASAVATGGQGGQGGNATATQRQTQAQSSSSTSSASSNSAANSTATASGNGNNSNNSVINNPQQVASAYAPVVLPTVPCFKGFSGGAQAAFGGISFGGGKIDQNCADLEAARQAPSLLARCKVYVANKYVKAAGVTLDDCLAIPAPPPPPAQVVIPAPQQPSITINVPAPVVTIIPGPVVAPPPSITAASSAALAAKVHHKGKPSPVVDNDTIKKP